MNTRTERPVRKPTGSKAARSNRRYHKQTAHVEARRDGKPLIFGWGKHLSHSEKIRLQRRSIWGMAALIVLLLVGVVVGAWINLNIIIPGLAITSVNGHSIPQSEFRTMVAVKTQIVLNELYGPNGLTTQATNLQKQDAQVKATISSTQTTITNLNNQIKALPAGNSTQRTNLNNQLASAQKTLSDNQTKDSSLNNQINDLNTNQIPVVKQAFTQSQIGNDSANWLQEDELIREWLTTQSASVQNKINPTSNQVNSSFNDLKRNTPTSNGYNTLFSSMGISDNDVRSMLTIIARRNNLQTYLAPQITSPSYQVKVRQIVTPTQAKANQALQDLKKGQDFGVVAAKNSTDVNTNNKGGDMGWLTRYQYVDPAGNIDGSPVVDDWLFDPARKINETSPVLYANSAYYILQITNIDPSRDVDATLLKALKANALVRWLDDRRYLPGQHITSVDQNMLQAPNNLPPNNMLPSAAPAATPGTSPSTPSPAATSGTSSSTPGAYSTP